MEDGTIQTLLEMGYTQHEARQALHLNNMSLDRALDWLAFEEFAYQTATDMNLQHKEIEIIEQPYEVNSDLDPTLKDLVEKANHSFSISNWKEAFTLYSQVAEKTQNGHVYFRLGVMYQNGHYVKTNTLMAEKYFKFALELLPLRESDPEAETDLGYIYDHGYGVPQDKEMAVLYYMKAASKCFPRALCNLGYMYGYGYGVYKDDTMAVKYYQKAVEKGNVTAVFNLGYMYDQGFGVPQDAAKAETLYLQAASQGHVTALFNLGYMYDYGSSGVQVNKKIAAQYYQQSADRGYVRAQTDIARCYQNGEGVPQDIKMAIKYYYLAVCQGNSEANKSLELIFTGESGPEAKHRAAEYLAGEWPRLVSVMNVHCKNAIMELFWIVREGWVQIPQELVVLITKALIIGWPGEHYVHMSLPEEVPAVH